MGVVLIAVVIALAAGVVALAAGHPIVGTVVIRMRNRSGYRPPVGELAAAVF